MKTIDRYIASTLIYHAALVMFLLCGLMLFGTFVSELGAIGQADYTALKAVTFTLLTLPKMAYDLFPIGLFIGTLLGLGSLATHNELTLLQSVGVSIFRIFLSLLRVAVLMMVVVMVMGEFVVPKAEELGHAIKSQAAAPKSLYRSEQGFWVRDKNTFVEIGSIPSTYQLGEVSIYRIDKDKKISSISTAQKAHYLEGEWRLENVQTLHLKKEAIHSTYVSRMPWNSPFSPELLSTLATKPASMTLRELRRYIDFLDNNELDSQSYRVAFWQKVSTPFSTLVMMMLALPCVLGLLRSSSLGIRIMVGTLGGVSFFLLNNMSSKLSLVYGLNPIMSAFLPSLLFLCLTLLLMRKTQ